MFVATNNVFVYNLKSEVEVTTLMNGTTTYDYDWAGNRYYTTNGLTGMAYVPNGLNQYSDVNGVVPEYDADGNLTSIPGTCSMYYDGRNQMTFYSSGSNTYLICTYDHQGRRIGKAVSGAYDSRYLYDGWNLLAEHQSSSIPPFQSSLDFYLWGQDLSGSEQGAGGVGGLLGVYRNGSWYMPLSDANGNVTEYINSSGTPVAHYQYDAFGNSIAQSGTMSADFKYRFSTKYFDSETGYYYYGLRFDDPAWGRWLNRDPLEEDGGLNLYGFCGNNGVNRLDLLGLTTIGEILDTYFSFSNTSPRKWIMPEEDPYTGIVRQWSYVKAFVDDAKRNLASSVSLWRLRKTTPGWEPGMSYIPDPNAKLYHTKELPLGTDPDTAMYNYAIYVITKQLHSNLNFIPVIQTVGLHTSAIGSFDIFATADEVTDCSATINIWMFNDMNKVSFGSYAKWFPWLPMASQIMWWNWKESFTFDRQCTITNH